MQVRADALFGYDHGVALPKPTGDPEGIEAIKTIAKERREYFVFLINEAKSNTDHTAVFTGADGRKYQLTINLAADQLEVTRFD